MRAASARPHPRSTITCASSSGSISSVEVGRKRRGNRGETLFEARARAFYVPQEIYHLAAQGRAPGSRPDLPEPAGVVALEARVALKTAGERRSFAEDWRKLVEKYAPRDDGNPRDTLFEAIALCVPAAVDPPPRDRPGQRSGGGSKGETIA